MPDLFQDQKKFMTVSGQTTDQHNESQYSMYLDLIREECQELEAAVASDDRIEQLDALIDILVVTVGAIHSLGVDAEGAWKEVLRSNMAKVDPASGRVLRREDGKILKPVNWEPPRLGAFLRKT